MPAPENSRLQQTVPERRRTRNYDVSNFQPLIDYLTEFLVPIGTIVTKLTTFTPGEAWVLIEGQSLSKKDYPDLYLELGGAFGETKETFNLPDLSEAYFSGAKSGEAGEFFGANGVTLSIENMPAHKHNASEAPHTHDFEGAEHSHTVTDPGHSHTSVEISGASGMIGMESNAAGGNTGTSLTNISIDPTTVDGEILPSTANVTLEETGGGKEFDNRPKSLSVYYFIKARV